MNSPYIFLIVGASGSGKGTLLKALKDMGDRHVLIIPKITTRGPKANDGNEIISIFPLKKSAFAEKYDIVYRNFGNYYGISSEEIFENLKYGKFQVVIVSNSDAITHLINTFGELVKLIYIYSPISEDGVMQHQKNNGTIDKNEINKRKRGLRRLHEFYVNNIAIFDHVLLNIKEPEDMYDQIFRMFSYYE